MRIKVGNKTVFSGEYDPSQLGQVMSHLGLTGYEDFEAAAYEPPEAEPTDGSHEPPERKLTDGADPPEREPTDASDEASLFAALAAEYCEDGQYGEAAEALEKALEIDGGNLSLVAELVSAYVMCGQHENAIKVLEGATGARKEKDMENVTIGIKGLRCENCSGFVEGALKALQGVRNVEVTLDPMQATLDYDPLAISLQEIKDTITNEEKGFSVA